MRLHIGGGGGGYTNTDAHVFVALYGGVQIQREPIINIGSCQSTKLSTRPQHIRLLVCKREVHWHDQFIPTNTAMFMECTYNIHNLLRIRNQLLRAHRGWGCTMQRYESVGINGNSVTMRFCVNYPRHSVT